MHLRVCLLFFIQAEDGIRDLVRSRGLGDVYKRQMAGGPRGNARASRTQPDGAKQRLLEKDHGDEQLGVGHPGLARTRPLRRAVDGFIGRCRHGLTPQREVRYGGRCALHGPRSGQELDAVAPGRPGPVPRQGGSPQPPLGARLAPGPSRQPPPPPRPPR